MYKAIEKIGEYNIGDDVPADKAELWLKMYERPPVKKVDNEKDDDIVNDKIVEEKVQKEDSNDSAMFDDYLGRNTNVVKRNIQKDNLTKSQLGKLLILEKSNKNRSQVITAIDIKLNKIED